ncbi:transmembrane protein, putative (macronuclear) [Tetrahymena thermophila SB210]|uniref:Transmembrane protein, putative n=1 Tax=Tetrahymena thermophila (strain SB210) TaxID=312017 RepID=Q24HI8_TETTS|nr:transmembrane protein, putative [Tetrahymena thermophila SB210]EAS07243.2 transmembrane protein, putative [Tetrahymena thermophila SB210]|eukprot:XP_001027485.2 transmembrane protein, putative [Tetrahymena thermophila SB210]
MTNIQELHGQNKYYLAFTIFLKQMLQVTFDIQLVDQTDLRLGIKQYGIKVFNQMTLQELFNKFLLSIFFTVAFCQGAFEKMSIKYFLYFIYLLLLINTVVLGYSVIVNIIKYYLNNEVVEFDEMVQFEDTLNKQYIYKDKKIQYIKIFSIQFDQNDTRRQEIMLQLFLFEFKNSEIFSLYANREKLVYVLQDQIVIFEYLLTAQTIFKIIQNRKILPQIKRIHFRIKDCNLYNFYRYFIQNHIDIQVFTNLDEGYENLCQFKNKIQLKTKTFVAQIIAFQNFLMSSMISDPKQILYDLFENDK